MRGILTLYKSSNSVLITAFFFPQNQDSLEQLRNELAEALQRERDIKTQCKNRKQQSLYFLTINVQRPW